MGNVAQPKLPMNASTPFERELVRALQLILNSHAQTLNELSGGKLGTWSAVSDTAPTHTASPGDTVRNSVPTVTGTVGSQYIIDGWRYGDDDAWHEISHLTDG